MTWSSVAALMALLTATLLVVKWIQGGQANRDALKLRQSELLAEQSRRRELERAAADRRRERLKVFDEKAAAVTDAAGADALLREATGSEPETN